MELIQQIWEKMLSVMYVLLMSTARHWKSTIVGRILMWKSGNVKDSFYINLKRYQHAI